MKKGDKVKYVGNGFRNFKNEIGEVMSVQPGKCNVIFDNYHHVGQYIIQNDSLVLVESQECTTKQVLSESL